MNKVLCGLFAASLMNVGFVGALGAQPQPQPQPQAVVVGRSPAELALAQQLFAEGNRVMATSPEQAGDLFGRAYALSSARELLYNAGMAFEHAHRDADAQHWYEWYLRVMRALPTRTSSDEDLIARVDAQLVLIRQRLNPAVVTPVLPPAPLPTIPVRTQPIIPSRRMVAERPLSVPALTCFGVGALSIGFAVYSMAQAMHSQGLVNEAQGRPLTPYLDQHERSISSAWTGAAISGGLGLGLVGLGVYLHLHRPTRTHEILIPPLLTVGAGPGDIGLSARMVF